VGNKRHAVEALKDTGDQFYLLRISPECGNLIWEMKKYRWKTYANKKLQYENNPYDEPHKKDDHACDALRYIIMTRPDLHATSGELTTDRVDGIMAQLEQKMIGTSGEFDVADPHGLTEAESSWEPGMSPRSVASETTAWELDEHMGGIL
jgi:hypothetical protein